MQGARFRGHSLGLSLQTGNHRRQSVLVDLEHTKETTHEAPEPFSTVRLASLEPAFRHKRYDRLKRWACLEVRGENFRGRKAETRCEIVCECDGHLGLGVRVLVDLGLLCVQSLRGGPIRVCLDTQSGADGQYFEEKGKTGTCMRILCRVTRPKEFVLIEAD